MCAEALQRSDVRARRSAAWALLWGLAIAACEAKPAATTTDVTPESDTASGADGAASPETVQPSDAVSPDLANAPDVPSSADAPVTPDGAPLADVQGGTMGACCTLGKKDCAAGFACFAHAQGATCMALLEKDECYRDSDCAGGQTCNGGDFCSCNMNCISGKGHCTGTPIAGCCASDKDCKDGQVCAGSGSLGVCKAAPKKGQCWSEAQCAAGETCGGPSTCPCNAECGAIDLPGTCTAGPTPGCCSDSAPCPPNAICIGGKEGGVCQLVPAPGECWTASDCKPGQQCLGASSCPCGAACFVADTVGKCSDLPIPGECCKQDSDCKDGEHCAGSVCKPPQSNGTCWVDVDCEEGTYCASANICPCGAACFAADWPGKCVPVPVEGTCCKSDFDCGPKQHCAGNGFGLGVCKPALDDGSCWNNADCPAGLACIGEMVCPCGALCGALADAPGKCAQLPPCCTTSAECGVGQVCTDPKGTGLGECVAAPEPGLCYSNADCNGGLCQGPSFCPCNADCAPSFPGKCAMDGACCTADKDCGAGYQCAFAAVGALDGVCVTVPTLGQCYSSDDCGGAECVGAAICPCGSVCKQGTSPGTCGGQAANECVKDGDCPAGGKCIAGETCVDWCSAGDPSCCFGNVCDPPNTCKTPNPAGCKTTGCAIGHICLLGLEWGCSSSTCTCFPGSEFWTCTKDCGGGVCMKALELFECDPMQNVGCKAGSQCRAPQGKPQCLQGEGALGLNDKCTLDSECGPGLMCGKLGICRQICDGDAFCVSAGYDICLKPFDGAYYGECLHLE